MRPERQIAGKPLLKKNSFPEEKAGKNFPAFFMH
jgi:hypothetical protein